MKVITKGGLVLACICLITGNIIASYLAHGRMPTSPDLLQSSICYIGAFISMWILGRKVE